MHALSYCDAQYNYRNTNRIAGSLKSARDKRHHKRRVSFFLFQVDFDRTKHLSAQSIHHRLLEKQKIEKLQQLREEEKRKEREEKERKINEERLGAVYLELNSSYQWCHTPSVFPLDQVFFHFI